MKVSVGSLWDHYVVIFYGKLGIVKKVFFFNNVNILAEEKKISFPKQETC